MKKILLVMLFSGFAFAQDNMNIDTYLNEDVKPFTRQLDFCLKYSDYVYHVKKYTLTHDNADPLYEIFLNELKNHDIREFIKNFLLSSVQSSEYFSKEIKDKDLESIERLSKNSRFVELEGCLGLNLSKNTTADLSFLVALTDKIKIELEKKEGEN